MCSRHQAKCVVLGEFRDRRILLPVLVILCEHDICRCKSPQDLVTARARGQDVQFRFAPRLQHVNLSEIRLFVQEIKGLLFAYEVSVHHGRAFAHRYKVLLILYGGLFLLHSFLREFGIIGGIQSRLRRTTPIGDTIKRWLDAQSKRQV